MTINEAKHILEGKSKSLFTLDQIDYKVALIMAINALETIQANRSDKQLLYGLKLEGET